uniref:Uncharacterized protein n=1 Tax=Solanum tuberosum TaxID=4113 RepID=M1DSS6_SOLTU
MSGGREKYPYETVTKFLDLVGKTNKYNEKDQQLIILLGQMDNLTQKIEELEVMSKEKIQDEKFVKKYRMNDTSPTGESPTRLATATKNALWILTVIEGPVKLGEIDEQSADRRVAKQT